MSKPNFQTMSQTELRAYVLSHPDDQEAFYALSDAYGWLSPTPP